MFTKEGFARLLPAERAELMRLQMSPGQTGYGGGGYLPADCSECGACGDTISGAGWCHRCYSRYEELVAKMGSA